jgi:Tfp pilus assembly protein PilV
MRASPPARLRGSTPPPRRGTATAESLVALVVLSVGVLALLGLMADGARQERRAAVRMRGTAMLIERAERARAGPCAPGEGSRSVDGYAEVWQADTGDGSLVLRGSVRLPPDARQTVALTIVRECPP